MSGALARTDAVIHEASQQREDFGSALHIVEDHERPPPPANGSPGAAPEAGATPANGSITPGAAPEAKPTPAA